MVQVLVDRLVDIRVEDMLVVGIHVGVVGKHGVVDNRVEADKLDLVVDMHVVVDIRVEEVVHNH
jgi:hypothetical protein